MLAFLDLNVTLLCCLSLYGINVHKYYFFYEVKGAFANFLHYCTDISKCKVLKEVPTLTTTRKMRVKL